MAIDFTLTPELEEIRRQVREFIDEVVKPGEARIEGNDGDGGLSGRQRIELLIEMRKQAVQAGLWLPHMPEEWGGMGLGHVHLAMVQAEAAKSYYGPWVLNCQAPDEGNMHTLLHWATPEQAGSDPTLIRTHAYNDCEEWVIDGHKWFISNAHRANFAILNARTEDDPDLQQAANTAFIIDLPADGWTEVRQIESMHGSTGHSEILIEDLRVNESQMLGGRGQGHMLSQYRLGPARLAHCMRWIAQAETALDMMVSRSLERFRHGSILAGKQDFKSEVSIAKHFVANSLNRIIDRAIQVHGALGYSTDTPLAHMFQQARWARFADGADEVHQMRIAQRTIAAYKDDGTTRAATGDLPI